MEGSIVLMALVAAAVIFIMKHNKKQQQPEQQPEKTEKPEITADAVIDVNGTKVPLFFNGLTVMFVQLPFRKDLYGMRDELEYAASRAAEAYGYGCAVVTYDIGSGDDAVGVMIRWQPLYGFPKTIRTIFRKDMENKIQQELEKVMPYKG